MKLPNKLKGKKSTWSEKAEFRIHNKKWLRYSSNIARRVHAAIEDSENLSQRVLADKIGVSVQYINRMLKGHQNLTLSTIAKLSDAVGEELISFPDYKYSKPAQVMVHGTFFADTANINNFFVLFQSAFRLADAKLNINSGEAYLVDTDLMHRMANLPIAHLGSTTNLLIGHPLVSSGPA